MIGDQRAAGAPPVDSLAEAIVLSWLVMQPELAEGEDIERLLVFKHHRWIWRAITRTHQLYPAATGATFVAYWLEDVQRAYPDHWLNLVDLLWPADTQSLRAWQEYELARKRDPDAVLLLATFQHPFEWWLARLKAVAEARTGIRAAQQIAERFWRVPERVFTGSEAAEILERAVPPQRPTLADRVLPV